MTLIRSRHVVAIVGGGIAGLQAARGLAKTHAEVHVFCDEQARTYSRTSLSKVAGLYNGSLAGKKTGPIELTRPADKAIVWHTGTQVRGVDLALCRLFLGDQRVFTFDYLVIASGSVPNRIEDRHDCSSHLHSSIYRLEDCARLGPLKPSSRRISVVGAGALGCEFAAMAASQGEDVTIFDVSRRGPLCSQIGAMAASRLRVLCESNGIKFVEGWPDLGTCSENVIGGEERPGAPDPKRSVIVEALGSSPNVDWLHGNDLDLSDGVEVDSSMAVSGFSNVFAVGDVARFPDPQTPSSSIRRVSWDHAVKSGKTAGRTIASLLSASSLPPTPTPVRNLPVFSSQIFGLRIRSSGRIHDTDTVEVSRGVWNRPRDGVLLSFFLRGELSGVVSLSDRDSYETDFAHSHHYLERHLNRMD